MQYGLQRHLRLSSWGTESLKLGNLIARQKHYECDARYVYSAVINSCARGSDAAAAQGVLESMEELREWEEV